MAESLVFFDMPKEPRVDSNPRSPGHGELRCRAPRSLLRRAGAGEVGTAVQARFLLLGEPFHRAGLGHGLSRLWLAVLLGGFCAPAMRRSRAPSSRGEASAPRSKRMARLPCDRRGAGSAGSPASRERPRPRQVLSSEAYSAGRSSFCGSSKRRSASLLRRYRPS